MPATEIEELLKQRIGLDAAAAGHSAILAAVRRRMARSGVSDLDEYCTVVRDSREELQALVEEVVVPETWFFRDKETFTALVQLIRDEWLPAYPADMLRLLSFPCSTGEEPYSMAMALLDAGLAPERFAVDGVDISDRALKVARRAIYSPNSFRGEDLTFRERYFYQGADGYHLSPSVLRQVHFRQGNLLGLGLKLIPGSYHFIFCRNALIYFDREAQEQAVAVLTQLLAPGGVLFVGHAEAFMVTARGFEPLGRGMGASFRKGTQCRQAPSASVRPAPRRITRVHTKTHRPGIPKLQIRHKPVEPVPQPSMEVEAGLEAATRFANAGKLTEAAEICVSHLRVHGPSSAAYYLLALVRDAQGDKDQAAECYRKTIYLEPSHVDALMHLAFQAEKEGNVAAARRLMERARRAEEIARQ